MISLYHGDCLEVLDDLAPDSVDAVVTDPPYGLDFMGKAWDGRRSTPFQTEFWRRVFRVLKPGGHVLAFGGTRTYHRLAVAIEDAGFEVRDMVSWLYGTGFPKSLDVSKAIDKAARGVPQGGRDPTSPNHGKFKSGSSAEYPKGAGFGAGPGQFMKEAGVQEEREYVPEAAQWQGWGTALKPAQEPICLARKPLALGTVAANVLAHGTGAINIDGCRVEASENLNGGAYALASSKGRSGSLAGGVLGATGRDYSAPVGRWPANVVHDGSNEVLAAFPTSKDGVAVQRNGGGQRIGGDGIYQGSKGLTRPDAGFGGEGSAARFFYSAKASKADRAGSKHPTVKPVSLIRWAARLITPPGGVVLDPFAGTGTTGVAALAEGFSAILVEREAEYVADIRRRFDPEDLL